MAITDLKHGDVVQIPENFPFREYGFTTLQYCGDKAVLFNHYLEKKRHIFAGKSADGKSGIAVALPQPIEETPKTEIDFSKYTFLTIIPNHSMHQTAFSELESLIEGEE
ncbi:Uncharacterised protein [uncultured archaeon]|nr:Uncharacterised protein [uncultured archaeon]